MEVLGKTPINLFMFVTGKISGYLTWIFLVLGLLDLNIIQVHSTPILKTIALLILAFGILLLILSSIYLGKSVRIGLPRTKTVLKQSGIYKFSRNPMYLGINLVTLASMIYNSNWIVIALGLLSIVTYHFIIVGEEKFLVQRFGEQYMNYRRVVHRYL